MDIGPEAGDAEREVSDDETDKRFLSCTDRDNLLCFCQLPYLYTEDIFSSSALDQHTAKSE